MRFMVVRPNPKRAGRFASEWLHAQVDSADAADEANALLTDPRDTIVGPKGAFLGALVLEYIDGRDWKVAAPFTYFTREGHGIDVHAGFVTDFASVPRFFWRVLPPTGPYGKAAVIHDRLAGRCRASESRRCPGTPNPDPRQL